MLEPVPVVIRGQNFPSICAAARALGLAPQTISEALDNGRLDFVGLGKGWRKQKELTE